MTITSPFQLESRLTKRRLQVLHITYVLLVLRTYYILHYNHPTHPRRGCHL